MQAVRPSIVFLQETWLNADTIHISIPDYHVVGRRDRSDLENRGGILTLCRSEFAHCISHVGSSGRAERMWHYLILNGGIYGLCNWYRPGSTGIEHIE